MNVFHQLCTPFIESLAEGEAFHVVVPKNADTDIENVLENEMDEENAFTKKTSVTRQLTDLDGCRSYAQIMAVASFVLELRTDGRTVDSIRAMGNMADYTQNSRTICAQFARRAITV
mgnify:CR=1 FL=1